jgi:hypothetical protein
LVLDPSSESAVDQGLVLDKSSLTDLLESFKDQPGAPIMDVTMAQNLPVAATPPPAGRIRWGVRDVLEPDDDRWESDGPYLADVSESQVPLWTWPMGPSTSSLQEHLSCPFIVGLLWSEGLLLIRTAL